MSIEVMTKVWKDAPVSGTELLLLLALADSANDDYECYPSIKHLAWKTRLSDRQVTRILQRLEAGSLIEVDTKAARGKRIKPFSAPNLYKITPDLWSKIHESGDTQDTTSGDTQDTTRNRHKESSKETPIAPNGAARSKKVTPYTKEQLDDLHDAICEVWRDLTPDMAIVNSIKQLLLNLPSAKGEWKRCACTPPVHAQELKLWRAWYRGDVLVRKPEQIQRSLYEYRRIIRLEAQRTANGHEPDTLVSQWDTDNEPIQQGVDYT